MAVRRASNEELNMLNNELNDEIAQALDDRATLMTALRREAEAMSDLLSGDGDAAAAPRDVDDDEAVATKARRGVGLPGPFPADDSPNPPPQAKRDCELDGLVAENASLHRSIAEAIDAVPATPPAPPLSPRDSTSGATPPASGKRRKEPRKSVLF